MTDLVTEVFSTLTYIFEEISNISPKYLPALVANISPTLIFYLCISITIFVICIYTKTTTAAQIQAPNKGELLSNLFVYQTNFINTQLQCLLFQNQQNLI